MDLLRGWGKEGRELVTGRDHDEDRQPGKNKQVAFCGGLMLFTHIILHNSKLLYGTYMLTHSLSPFSKRLKEDKIRLF